MGELARERVRLGGAESVVGVIPGALMGGERADGKGLVKLETGWGGGGGGGGGKEVRQGWLDWMLGLVGLEVKRVGRGAHGEKGDSAGERSAGLEASLLGTSVYGTTHIMPSLSARKAHMIELVATAGPGSGFIALSGGFGTLDEVLEVVTARQMGVHRREMVLCNVEGFWDGIVSWVEGAMKRGFVREGSEGNGLLVCKEGVEHAVNWLVGERGEDFNRDQNG